jgi:hypothetical protein
VVLWVYWFNHHADASTDEIPSGDLETAKAYAKRIKAITEKFIAA